MNDLTKYLITSLLLENEDINELQPSEIKYWALHADIFDTLKKDSDYKRVYIYLKNKLTGERLKALEYFYNEYFLNPKNPTKAIKNEDYDTSLKLLLLLFSSPQFIYRIKCFLIQ